MKKIILASNSPRRKELFSLFHWPFEVIPAEIDETQECGEKPQAYVWRLAHQKAEVVAAQYEGLVIAADTIVVDGGQLIGKPGDEPQARAMLDQLRGRCHQVYTGIMLIHTPTGKTYQDICCTDVPMREYSQQEIEAYISTGDPMDKAGAYAIQHRGFHPVERLKGCYASVMGLPLCHLLVGFRKLGLETPVEVPIRCQDFLDYVCPVSEQILTRH